MISPITTLDRRLLTQKAVARRLDVSLPTLRKLVREGTLPEPIRLGRRWVRFLADDIDQFLEDLLRQRERAALRERGLRR